MMDGEFGVSYRPAPIVHIEAERRKLARARLAAMRLRKSRFAGNWAGGIAGAWSPAWGMNYGQCVAFLNSLYQS